MAAQRGAANVSRSCKGTDLTRGLCCVMMLASDSLFRTAAVTGVDSLYDEHVAGWNGAAVARSSLIIARRPLPRRSGVGAKSLAPPKLSSQTFILLERNNRRPLHVPWRAVSVERSESSAGKVAESSTLAGFQPALEESSVKEFWREARLKLSSYDEDCNFLFGRNTYALRQTFCTKKWWIAGLKEKVSSPFSRHYIRGTRILYLYGGHCALG